MLLCLMMAGSLNVHAQKARNRRMGIKADSIIQVKDSLVIDSLNCWKNDKDRKYGSTC